MNNKNRKAQTLIEQLLVLRKCLLKSVLFVLLVFVCLVGFSSRLYTMVAEPLQALLPNGAHMIATEVASSFLAPFKLTFIISIFLSLPYFFYQLWSFVAPGLYRHEKRLILPLLLMSLFLFLSGMAFAYFIVFPLLFHFFTQSTPEGVVMMTDINQYLSFVLTLLFAFGLAFEIPVATVLFIRSGVVSRQRLSKMRPYVILGCFVVGMLLTPPDVFSQTLLAIPMWLLFEAGLLLTIFYEKNLF